MRGLHKRRSIFLSLAMLWHCLTLFFVNGAAVSASPEKISCQNETRQEIVVISQSLPVLAEVKHLESSSKKPTQNQSINCFSDSRFQNCKLAAEDQHGRKSLQSFVVPVKRGYWLLYRSLLI